MRGNFRSNEANPMEKLLYNLKYNKYNNKYNNWVAR
jgi:hypothetical protein